MKYCTKCVMPSTRPGITFNEQGVCATRMVRYGMITRDEVIKLVKECDHALAPRCVREFCEFLGYSRRKNFGK